MLRLISGRAGTGKTALLFSEIAARCARRQSGSFLIVPEQYSHLSLIHIWTLPTT